MMLAMLGMAVGTGNIWRFPRIAAQNGGGEFLVAWVVFLLLWSVPLILLEFAMGRHFRSGPVRAFGRMMGPRWAWMGAFGAFVGVAILFYYSVVAGWTFRYALAAITGEVPGSRPGAFWSEYTSSYWPIVTHGAAMGIGTYVVGRGVKAIERVQAAELDIRGAVCVLDRLAGGGEAITEAADAPFHALTTIDDVYPDRPDR